LRAHPRTRSRQCPLCLGDNPSAQSHRRLTLCRMSTITEFRWPQARHVASTLRQPFFRICPSVIQGMGFEDQPIVLPIAELKLDQVSKGSIAIRQRARPTSGSASSSPLRRRSCPGLTGQSHGLPLVSLVLFVLYPCGSSPRVGRTGLLAARWPVPHPEP